MSSNSEAGPSKRGFHASSCEASNLPHSTSTFPILPIVDIFDAPARLGGRFHFTTRSRVNLVSDASACSRIPSRSTSKSLRLPPPLLLDGPARPTHPSFKRRTSTRSRPTAHLRLLSAMTPPQTAQPLVELFDGPARIVRSSTRSPKQVLYFIIKMSDNTYSIINSQATTLHLLLLGLTGTIFCGMIQISTVALDKADSVP